MKVIQFAILPDMNVHVYVKHGVTSGEKSR